MYVCVCVYVCVSVCVCVSVDCIEGKEEKEIVATIATIDSTRFEYIL